MALSCRRSPVSFEEQLNASGLNLLVLSGVKKNTAEVKRPAWIICLPLLPACFCSPVGYSHRSLRLTADGERQRVVYSYGNPISLVFAKQCK